MITVFWCLMRESGCLSRGKEEIKKNGNGGSGGEENKEKKKEEFDFVIGTSKTFNWRAFYWLCLSISHLSHGRYRTRLALRV